MARLDQRERAVWRRAAGSGARAGAGPCSWRRARTAAARRGARTGRSLGAQARVAEVEREIVFPAWERASTLAAVEVAGGNRRAQVVRSPAAGAGRGDVGAGAARSCSTPTAMCWRSPAATSSWCVTGRWSPRRATAACSRAWPAEDRRGGAAAGIPVRQRTVSSQRTGRRRRGVRQRVGARRRARAGAARGWRVGGGSRHGRSCSARLWR